MKSVVCTLFEGNYHYGVGALTNSLYRHGFRGVVCAGYRGELPRWATRAERRDSYSELAVAPDLAIRFIPLTTHAHLTNYKPDFMLSVWGGHFPDAEALFYFDPDIVLLCRWSFFEEWAAAGLAVCGDVNTHMPPDHPLRHAWMRYYEPHGFLCVRRQHIYYNGGFLGVAREYRNFLCVWQRLQQLMEPAIGGLKNVGVGDRTFLFCKTDQDALNVATMVCEEPVSSVGADGMDLQHGGGGYIMSHAVGGAAKPWRRRIFLSALKAQPPDRAVKAFLQNVTSPIRLYSPRQMLLKRIDLLAGSAVGRYIR